MEITEEKVYNMFLFLVFTRCLNGVSVGLIFNIGDQKSLFVAVVETVYLIVYKDGREIEDIEFKRAYTSIIRNLWGYCIVFKGVSEEQVSYEELFDPDLY